MPVAHLLRVQRGRLDRQVLGVLVKQRLKGHEQDVRLRGERHALLNSVHALDIERRVPCEVVPIAADLDYRLCQVGMNRNASFAQLENVKRCTHGSRRGTPADARHRAAAWMKCLRAQLFLTRRRALWEGLYNMRTCGSKHK